ncbi:MAG: proton-conducting transporter membrane subunit [Bacteroidales bacterium]
MMIVLFLIGALLISCGLFFNRNRTVNYILVCFYLALLWLFGVYECFHLNQTEFTFFTVDSLGLLLLLVLCLVAGPALFHGYRYLEKHNADETPHSRGLFFGAMVLLITACSVAYLSNHIAVTWIFVEITTLSASALIYHHRTLRALEGVWKYVFICAISITFIYVGILFLSLSMKGAGIEDMSFASLYQNRLLLDPYWLKLSFLFIFTGFTAKFGLVPMYTAGIDAKDKAPAPAGALLSSILMNLGFVGVYRVYGIMAQTPMQEWARAIMIISGLLSIFVAAVYMTRIKNIKRMFAYSGIEHMGLVVLGLAVGGVGVYAAILHILLHTLVKPTLFFQYNQIYWVYQSKSVNDIGDYFKYNKTGAILLLLAFFSATAMPPSGLFVSEFMIFQSLFESHQILMLLVVVLLLTLIIWGFGSNIFKLLFTPLEKELKESQIPHISPWESLSQYVMLAFSVYLAYNPPMEMVDLINNAVRIIQ